MHSSKLPAPLTDHLGYWLRALSNPVSQGLAAWRADARDGRAQVPALTEAGRALVQDHGLITAPLD